MQAYSDPKREARYYAIPLAERGFVPIDPVRNPVRWYVEMDGRAWPLLGPYDSQAHAEFAARELNREEVQS